MVKRHANGGVLWEGGVGHTGDTLWEELVGECGDGGLFGVGGRIGGG